MILCRLCLFKACLICRKGFASRLAWASHAARLHQYRTVASQLARGCVCLGCGKTYASTGRLKRHLDASLSCQRTWGSFVPEDASATAHSQMPPHVAAGAFQDASLLPVASSFEDTIARSLASLDPCTTEDALDVFKSFVQPLSALRAAAERWRDGLGGMDPAHPVAAQVVILLHPEVVCDTPGGRRARPSLDENEFPIFAPLKPFCVAMACEPLAFAIDNPPAAIPVWPWTHFGTLREARRQQEWARAALRTCAAAAQASTTSAVAIRVSAKAQQVLGVALVWLVQGGFSWVAGFEGSSLVSPRIYHAIGAS